MNVLSHGQMLPRPRRARSGSAAVDADLLPDLRCVLVADRAADEREQGVVAADAHIVPCLDGRATLSHQDGARVHDLPVTSLHAEALPGAVASVSGAAHSLLVSHQYLLRSHDVADT